jgi:hypothetical protein
MGLAGFVGRRLIVALPDLRPVRDTRRRPFEITEYGIRLRRLRVAAMRGFTTTCRQWLAGRSR